MKLGSWCLGFVLSAVALCGAQERTDLFVAGENGYALFRIPALVMTPQQSLLAACEARRLGRSDWDHVDLFVRRSGDSGKTWESARCLVGQADLPVGIQRNPAAIAAGFGREGVFTIHNPTWIADHDTGETHLLYCVEYQRCFMVTTRDGGITFSRPRELTAAFATFRTRYHYNWRVIAVGPGHGVQLSTGRLVAAVWLSTGEGAQAHRPSLCATIFSDDHGLSWQAGQIVARDSDELRNPSETAIVEAGPGKVMLNLRSESPRHRRAISWSADGAGPWSQPAFDEALYEPVCMGSLARCEPVAKNRPPILLFCNPASLEPSRATSTTSVNRPRQNLTLRVSRDAGQTWPIARVIEPGPSAYSDLATDPAGTIFCFYERGGRGPYELLTLVRLPLAELAKDAP